MSSARKRLADCCANENEIQQIRDQFGSAISDVRPALDGFTVFVARDAIFAVCQWLKSALAYEQLIDLCAVDMSEMASHSGKRFVVVYHLLSVSRNTRLRLKVEAADREMVDSVVDIWPTANWLEREAFDLFGVIFRNHPDLRRLLTDYGFEGHPLRKDFPLTGRVELFFDEAQWRCVYKPNKLENRVLVPKVWPGVDRG